MVYRIKNEHDGSKRYNTKLVVKGFQQKEGIDIFFSCEDVNNQTGTGNGGYRKLLEQLDVKTAFLHGDLEEDFYMIQLKGFIVQG